MSVVLDASAVLAYLRDEPGASTVGEAIAAWVDDQAAAPLVSTVNWTEIGQRVWDAAILEELETVVEIVPCCRRAARDGRRPLPTHPGARIIARRSCLPRSGDLPRTARSDRRSWLEPRRARPRDPADSLTVRSPPFRKVAAACRQTTASSR